MGGYGGAAHGRISPLATSAITNYGISGSFIGLGCLFAVVVIIAGRLLVPPPEGYVPPAPIFAANATKSVTATAIGAPRRC